MRRSPSKRDYPPKYFETEYCIPKVLYQNCLYQHILVRNNLDQNMLSKNHSVLTVSVELGDTFLFLFESSVVVAITPVSTYNGFELEVGLI